MVDVTVIILTKNEELHLGRCLERLRALGPRRVVVVDSESTDATADLARRGGSGGGNPPVAGQSGGAVQLGAR